MAVAGEREQRIATVAQEITILEAQYPSALFRPNPAQARCLEKIREVYLDPAARYAVNIFPWLGANDTGKTRLLNEMIAAFMRGPQSPWLDFEPFTSWPRPTTLRLISTQKALEEGSIVELRRLLGPWLAPGYPKKGQHPYEAKWRTTNGSRLDLLTWDQDITQHAGSFADGLFADEPGKKSIASEAMARLRRGGIFPWFLTPVDEENRVNPDIAWIVEQIRTAEETPDLRWFPTYADAEDNCIEHGRESFTTSDGVRREAVGIVPHEVLIDRYNRYKGDPRQLAARWHGKHASDLGLVLDQWSEKNIYEKLVIRPSWPRLFSLDTHPVKPEVGIYAVVSPWGEFYIIKEIVNDGMISEVAQEIREVFLAYGYPSVALIDPLAATPNKVTGVSVFQEYKDHGCVFTTAGPEKAEKTVLISRMNDMLAGVNGRPQLYVHKDCRFTISQAKRWSYDLKTQQPGKVHDDAWEAIYRMIPHLPLPPDAIAHPRGARPYKSNLVV